MTRSWPASIVSALSAVSRCWTAATSTCGLSARTKSAASCAFGSSHLIVAEDGLTLQVRAIDDVVVDDRQASDAGAGEARDDRAADAARTDDCDACRLQPALPDAADLREDDLPCVALQLVVAEFGHRPVLPNPPLPRAVSSSSCTSVKWARSTGAGTSWAMRSPRRISNGSSPRLARMTFTSPR